jgi:hypothetical protein
MCSALLIASSLPNNVEAAENSGCRGISSTYVLLVVFGTLAPCDVDRCGRRSTAVRASVRPGGAGRPSGATGDASSPVPARGYGESGTVRGGAVRPVAADGARMSGRRRPARREPRVPAARRGGTPARAAARWWYRGTRAREDCPGRPEDLPHGSAAAVFVTAEESPGSGRCWAEPRVPVTRLPHPNHHSPTIPAVARNGVSPARRSAAGGPQPRPILSRGTVVVNRRSCGDDVSVSRVRRWCTRVPLGIR